MTKQDEQKFRKCRNCSKDVELGQPCECGWDEDKAQGEVRKQRLFREIEREQTEAEKKSSRGEKRNPFGF